MSCRTLCESVASTTSMVDNSTTSMVDDSMLTSCQTLCASSVTDLVDTENTPFIDRWEHCIWYLLMGLFLTAQCAEFAFALSFFISQYEQNTLTSRCCQNNPQPLYHRPPRLVSSSSQGTLVASDCDLLDDDDDIDNDRDFEL